MRPKSNNSHFSRHWQGRGLILACLLYCTSTSSGATFNSIPPIRTTIDTTLKRSISIGNQDSLKAENEYNSMLQATSTMIIVKNGLTLYGSDHTPTKSQIEKLDSLRLKVNNYRRVHLSRKFTYGSGHPPVEKEN